MGAQVRLPEAHEGGAGVKCHQPALENDAPPILPQCPGESLTWCWCVLSASLPLADPPFHTRIVRASDSQTPASCSVCL